MDAFFFAVKHIMFCSFWPEILLSIKEQMFNVHFQKLMGKTSESYLCVSRLGILNNRMVLDSRCLNLYNRLAEKH